MKNISAFTIIELLVVIVIIGILATLAVVSYVGLVSKATVSSLRSDLTNNAKKIKLYQSQYGSYPTSINTGTGCPTAPTSTTDPAYCLVDSGSNVITSYIGSSTGFTLSMNSGNLYYQITESTSPLAYVPVPDGSLMQTINSSNCPSIRTRAVDARDNHTYWVQKLADGKCWILTNLAYAGGGTNTYGDTKTLINGTSLSVSLTDAHYYVVPSTTNFTTEPTNPSTSTDGTGQYGYLYNWCGVMAGQATAACSGTSKTPTPTTVSICPSGWRLPTVNEYSTLNNTINGGSLTSVAGLKSTWLVMFGGIYYNGFSSDNGYYWSSSYDPTTDTSGWAYQFFVPRSTFNINFNNYPKNYGFAARCVAS